MLNDVFDGLVDHLLECVGIFAQLLCRSCERLGDAGPKLCFKHWQHTLAHSHAGESRVEVVWVVPCSEPARLAACTCGGASNPEQGADASARHRRHALQARPARSPGQPEQHRFGLVVERVAEQNCTGSEHVCLGLEGGVSRVARGGLWAGTIGDIHPHHHGLEPEGFGLASGVSRGIHRAVLQAVVDHHRDRPDAKLWRLERGRCGERERIGAAAERDYHDGHCRLLERPAHGATDLGHGWGQGGQSLVVHPATLPPGRLSAPIHQTPRSTRMAAYDAIIEIPRGSRNKYEVDHITGRVYLDRVLFTGFGYPADYGFFENTLGEDGDPLDVLVLLEYPLFPGIGVKVRPVGVLKMSDEAGGDDKVIAVQAKDPRWAHIQDVDDIPAATRAEIGHFFEHYKDLEPNKWVKVDEWANAAEAERLIVEAIARLAAEGH